jgi:hypothetical protein
VKPGPIWVSGATGLLGGRLVPRLRRDDQALRLVSRSARPDQRPEHIRWDGVRADPADLRSTSAALHLSGEPVFGGLPTAARRRRIWNSRIDSTRALVEAIGDLPADERPDTLVCASAVGFYGDRGDEFLDEQSPPGEGFLAELCTAWEREAAQVEGLGVRRVSLRFGIVLAREGGALALMARAFRLGLGGRLGSGRQWFPWVHIDDAVELTLLALSNEELRGPLNAVSPNPVTNLDLTANLGQVLRRPTLLAAPAFAVRAALGPLANELLGSKRVRGAAAGAAGATWRHGDLDGALTAELA